MSDEDQRWHQLSRESANLSIVDLEILEKQLRQDPSNMDIRVQILAYYGQPDDEKGKYTEQKLLEHVLWLIENKPSISGHLSFQISIQARIFKPKAFATLREAWLEQVSAAPLDGTIIGNAASFIVWKDIETAYNLFERAYALQPKAGWLGTFIIHLNSELTTCPDLYANTIREQVVDIGHRSLETEPGFTSFLTCEYVADAALHLGRFAIVRECAETLLDWSGAYEQMANAYLGLVALRENNRTLAIRLMLEMRPGYRAQDVVFRLAGELFDSGERESIAQLIRSLKGKVRASVRNRWLKQIASDQRPDFKDY